MIELGAGSPLPPLVPPPDRVALEPAADAVALPEPARPAAAGRPRRTRSGGLENKEKKQMNLSKVN